MRSGFYLTFGCVTLTCAPVQSSFPAPNCQLLQDRSCTRRQAHSVSVLNVFSLVENYRWPAFFIQKNSHFQSLQLIPKGNFLPLIFLHSTGSPGGGSARETLPTRPSPSLSLLFKEQPGVGGGAQSKFAGVAVGIFPFRCPYHYQPK